MRDPLDQLYLGQSSLKVQHLFHTSEKEQLNCAGAFQEPENVIVTSIPFC